MDISVTVIYALTNTLNNSIDQFSRVLARPFRLSFGLFVVDAVVLTNPVQKFMGDEFLNMANIGKVGISVGHTWI